MKAAIYTVFLFSLPYASYCLAAPPGCGYACLSHFDVCFNTLMAENIPRNASERAQRICSETYLHCTVECDRRDKRNPGEQIKVFIYR